MWMLKKRRFLTIVFFLTTSCNNEPSKSKLTSQLTSFKTNDIGNTLEEVLERDRTQPSCDAYWNLLDDEDMPLKNSDPNQLDELEVLCGKWLFIGWETTGKLPLPEILFDAVKRSWPDRVGKNFEKLGFLPNPTDPAGRPLGIARSTTKYTGMPSVNVTCAACHVGQLPDGRYAIGAPNTKLDLSTFNLMSYYPLYMAMSNDSRSELPKAVQEFFRELEKTERKRVLGGKYLIDWSNLVFKYSKMLRMLNIGPKGLPDAQFVVMPPPAISIRGWMVAPECLTPELLCSHFKKKTFQTFPSLKSGTSVVMRPTTNQALSLLWVKPQNMHRLKSLFRLHSFMLIKI